MDDKVKLTTGLISVMVLLGVSDAVIIEGLPGSHARADSVDKTPPVIETHETDVTDLPPGAVVKNDGARIADVLTSLSIETTENRQPAILSNVVKEGLQNRVLIYNGDRAGVMAWVESPEVKQYYVVLKEALHNAFTPDVRDLVDETQRREGRPTRNLLTFIDPGLVSERVVFIRVRERLFEFHVADGQSEVIFDIIEELTK